jgi:hypothetical protein
MARLGYSAGSYIRVYCLGDSDNDNAALEIKIRRYTVSISICRCLSSVSKNYGLDYNFLFYIIVYLITFADALYGC